MYVPPEFAEERLPVLHEAIRQARLVTLVTVGSDGIEASHVPILLAEREGSFGTLYGHLAKANPQWRRARTDQPALAIAMGPDAYVSPGWYQTKEETGKVVPTWNYVALHATGSLAFFEDVPALRDLVGRLTDRHEAGRDKPWSIDDAPPDYLAARLKGIVGFRLEITRLEGKWKLSQNRPLQDRRGVVAGLKGAGGDAETALARLMADKG